MHNYRGSTLVLTGDWQLIDSARQRTTQLNVRTPAGSGTVYFSADGSTICGYILATEARQWLNTSPSSIYVRGAAGNVLYWDATE